jgi:hypothetical protein
MIHPRSLMGPLLAIILLAAGLPNGRGQDGISEELQIKAGLIALQCRLWTWPPGAAPAPGMPFKLGVLGKDPFQQDAVNHLTKSAAGQNLVVERFADIEACQPCHILFVSQAADLPAALVKVQGQPVLVITHAPGLAKQGAVLNLVVVQNRVKMEINMSAARNAGLTPNHGLVRNAEIVQK